MGGHGFWLADVVSTQDESPSDKWPCRELCSDARNDQIFNDAIQLLEMIIDVGKTLGYSAKN